MLADVAETESAAHSSHRRSAQSENTRRATHLLRAVEANERVIGEARCCSVDEVGAAMVRQAVTGRAVVVGHASSVFLSKSPPGRLRPVHDDVGGEE